MLFWWLLGAVLLVALHRQLDGAATGAPWAYVTVVVIRAHRAAFLPK